MNTTTKLAAFGLALVAIVGTGAGIGATVGPDATPAAAEAPAPIGQGVVATAEGYRLVPLDHRPRPRRWHLPLRHRRPSRRTGTPTSPRCTNGTCTSSSSTAT